MKVSAALTVAFAIAGVFMAMITDSMSLLLDALYGVADMIISIAAVFAVRKIHAPADRKYHYGYAKLEPFMTGINGTLILALCCCTIITSIQDVLNADPVKYLHLIIAYSFISMVVCCFFGLYMLRRGREWGSEVVLVDSQLWMVEAIISLAICIAFGIGLVFEEIPGWGQYTTYVDPVTCIALSLFLISQPAKIIWGSFRDLLDACPADDISGRISALVDDCRNEHGLKSVEWLRLRKAGRRLFLTVCFSTSEDHDIKEMNSIREDISRKLNLLVPELDLCVLFSSKD
ncbi:MAG: cation diffusion facilitator family transporter [Victivallales bacterium]